MYIFPWILSFSICAFSFVFLLDVFLLWMPPFSIYMFSLEFSPCVHLSINTVFSINALSSVFYRHIACSLAHDMSYQISIMIFISLYLFCATLFQTTSFIYSDSFILLPLSRWWRYYLYVHAFIRSIFILHPRLYNLHPSPLILPFFDSTLSDSIMLFLTILYPTTLYSTIFLRCYSYT